MVAARANEPPPAPAERRRNRLNLDPRFVGEDVGRKTVPLEIGQQLRNGKPHQLGHVGASTRSARTESPHSRAPKGCDYVARFFRN